MKKFIGLMLAIILVFSSMAMPISGYAWEADEVLEGAVRYELDEYDAALKTANASASGGYLVGTMQCKATDWQNAEISFDVTVSEAGLYELSYAVGQKLTNDTSPIEVYFGDEKLGANDASYRYDISNLKTYPWQHTPMRLYKFEKELEAGTYPVSFKVSVCPNATSYYKFYADYFQVTPLHDPELNEYETTKIEFERYAANSSDVRDLEGASDRRIVGNTWASSNPKMTIPVSVKKSGFYDVTYAVGYLNKAMYKGSVSEITIKIGDKVIGTNDDSFVEKLSYDYWSIAPMSKYEKGIWLDEGDYSLTVEMSECGSGVWKYQADYIEFSYRHGEISSEGTSVVEFEDYMTGYISSLEGASGGKVIGTGGSDSAPQISIPVDVEESGFYDVTYAVGYLNKAAYNGSVSEVIIKIGDKEIGRNDDSFTEKLSYNFWHETYAPMSKYEKRVWLDKGEYSLTMEVSECSGNRWKFQADYISFAPHYAEISSSKESTIEFEAYKTTSYEVEGASGDRVIGSLGATTDPSYAIPVVVEESGFYNITYAVGYLPSIRKDLSKVTIKVGNKVIGTNDDSFTETLSYNYSWLNQHIPMSKYEKGIWLDSGKYFLNLEIGIDSASQYKYQADYISFKPFNAEISLTEKTTLEFEKYYSQNATLEGASGDKVIASLGASGAPTGGIPVMVKESGYYDINYAVGYLKNNSPDLSKITIKIDDEVIGTNDNSFTEALSYNYSWAETYIPMSRYEKKVWLDSGRHVITIEVAAAKDGYFKYQADYISLQPSDDFINVDGGDVEVFASYNEPVSGLAIVALYNGQSLVSICDARVENSHLVKITHAENKPFDKVKMFIWGDLDKLIPVAGEVK